MAQSCFAQKIICSESQLFIFEDYVQMSFPYVEYNEENSDLTTQQKIWLNSIYWGMTGALLLYAVTKESFIYVLLRSYLRQILPTANVVTITFLGFVAAALLLMMITEIWKYLCFGKSFVKMVAFASVIVVLHTAICFYGALFQSESKKTSFEPGIVDSRMMKR